jgi:D-alanine transaminase
MPEIAYVNGEFMPLAEAVVSIEDRGFQFADGVYEVIATYKSRPYAMEEHLQRLERSLKELHIKLNIREYGLESLVDEGMRRSGFAESMIYIQITRGVAPRHHEFPAADVKPTVVMTIKELQRLPDERYDKGVRVITAADLRWKRCDIKSVSLLANILAKQQAKEAGAFEAFLFDEQGRITEGASTSAFCIRAGTLWATPCGPHILPSITRGILLQLAQKIQLPIRQEFCSLEDYLRADEVFLAGTSAEAIGVVQIDDVIIGDGAPGPITGRLRKAFLQTVE